MRCLQARLDHFGVVKFHAHGGFGEQAQNRQCASR